MRRTHFRPQKGFTLIELMISLTILAFLGYFTSEMMRSTTQQSQKIRTEVEQMQELKAAARIIKSDISRAFNTRDVYIAIYNEAQRERIREWQRSQANQGQQQGQNPNDGNAPSEEGGAEGNEQGTGTPNPNPVPPPHYEPREELIVTQFLGEKDKIDLTTVSGVRVRKNVKASDLIEVGYYTDTCRRRANRDESTNCLWRRISYFLDGEVNVGGDASVLLEDVTKFELQYLRLRGENIEWIDRWMSDQNGDDITRDALPPAVQLQLEIERALDKAGENKKSFDIISYIPIYFTNNANVKTLIQLNSQGNPLEAPLAQGGLGGLGSGPGLAPNSQNSPFGQGTGGGVRPQGGGFTPQGGGFTPRSNFPGSNRGGRR